MKTWQHFIGIFLTFSLAFSAYAECIVPRLQKQPDMITLSSSLLTSTLFIRSVTQGKLGQVMPNLMDLAGLTPKGKTSYYWLDSDGTKIAVIKKRQLQKTVKTSFYGHQTNTYTSQVEILDCDKVKIAIMLMKVKHTPSSFFLGSGQFVISIPSILDKDGREFEVRDHTVLEKLGPADGLLEEKLEEKLVAEITSPPDFIGKSIVVSVPPSYEGEGIDLRILMAIAAIEINLENELKSYE